LPDARQRRDVARQVWALWSEEQVLARVLASVPPDWRK
jgi:hypothetical protein